MKYEREVNDFNVIIMDSLLEYNRIISWNEI